MAGIDAHESLDPGPLQLTIIVPVLDEIERLPGLLTELLDLSAAQVVVVDGGSRDGSVSVCRDFCRSHAHRFRLVESAPGRAVQMNRGAAQVHAGWIVFLHADTRLPGNAFSALERAARSGCEWGRFDVDFASRHLGLRLVAWSMNMRSRLTGIATGDQAIFVRAKTFAALGGYPEIPLMEDIALAKMLRARARPCRIRTPVVTSARRWRRRGWLRTVVTMWALRCAYWFGVDPGRLARRYPQVR